MRAKSGFKKTTLDREVLESLYNQYNKREFVHPDPLEFLYDYPDVKDREIVGLIASSLAYGQVLQILKSVKTVLSKFSDSPFIILRRSSEKKLKKLFCDFKHRFTTGDEMSWFLSNISKIIREYGSLFNCFKKGCSFDEDNYSGALSKFAYKISGGCSKNMSLLASPADGSACKRLNLFLRWMIRKDEVDPGGWDGLNPSGLIVPLDVHMFRISGLVGFTKRKQPDIKTAIEITDFFKNINPQDPVKYDFSITRLGIRPEQTYDPILRIISK